MNLCVLLLLLTTTTTGIHLGTKVDWLLRFFGIIGKPKKTEPQLQLEPVPVPQEDSSYPNPLPPILPYPSHEPEPDPQVRSSTSPPLPTPPKLAIKPEEATQTTYLIGDQLNESPTSLPLLEPQWPSNTINYKQPHLRDGISRNYYADITFLGTDSVLVTIQTPDLTQSEIFYPLEQFGQSIDESGFKISQVKVDDQKNITILKYKYGAMVNPFWFQRLESENDIPHDGFIYANEIFYSCKIERTETPYVKIIILVELPQGTIKPGTRVIGKTGNDKGLDTLIAIIIDEKLSMAVVTSIIPKEKIYID